jgi:hypothetical protein
MRVDFNRDDMITVSTTAKKRKKAVADLAEHLAITTLSRRRRRNKAASGFRWTSF